MNEIDVEVALVHPRGILPRYGHDGDAGSDLATVEDIVLAPGARQLVPTGVCIAIPDGYAGFIHPRSGLAVRSGLGIVNSPGVIDAGYRGEIKVCLINTDPTTEIRLACGDFIAQLVIQPVCQARFSQVDSLTLTTRGSQGFGSTGGVSAWVHDETISAQQKGQ
ncbi:MAG: dUTP diphosphatase [Propionibacteriaceae bacterium]|nr:dUTP diphosphatase [Propionibacteriaceae bacterium]